MKTNKILFKTYKIKFDLVKNCIKKTLKIGSGNGILKYFLINPFSA